MKILLVFLASLFVTELQAQELKDLAWLSGTWQSQGESFTTLTVSYPNGKKMMATESQFRVMGGASVIRSYENFEIRMGNTLELEVFPKGQKSLVMKVSNTSKYKVTFENETHDFPQQWTFELLNDGTLVETATGSGRRIQIKFIRRDL